MVDAYVKYVPKLKFVKLEKLKAKADQAPSHDLKQKSPYP